MADGRCPDTGKNVAETWKKKNWISCTRHESIRAGVEPATSWFEARRSAIEPADLFVDEIDWTYRGRCGEGVDPFSQSTEGGRCFQCLPFLAEKGLSSTSKQLTETTILNTALHFQSIPSLFSLPTHHHHLHLHKGLMLSPASLLTTTLFTNPNPPSPTTTAQCPALSAQRPAPSAQRPTSSAQHPLNRTNQNTLTTPRFRPMHIPSCLSVQPPATLGGFYSAQNRPVRPRREPSTFRPHRPGAPVLDATLAPEWTPPSSPPPPCRGTTDDDLPSHPSFTPRRRRLFRRLVKSKILLADKTFSV